MELFREGFRVYPPTKYILFLFEPDIVHPSLDPLSQIYLGNWVLQKYFACQVAFESSQDEKSIHRTLSLVAIVTLTLTIMVKLDTALSSNEIY